MEVTLNTYSISNTDKAALREAKARMEHIGWAMQRLNSVGNVLESGINKLSPKQREWLREISRKVLLKVVRTNLLSMKHQKKSPIPHNNRYKALVTTSGMLGGVLGMAGFVADLAVATKLMMRSILDIARAHGEDISSFDTQLACLQVFALGGKSVHDDSLDTGYYATRLALSSTVKSASAFVVKNGSDQLVQGLLKNSANPLLRVIGAIASRFGVQVSEKFVAQAIPVIGAAGGGAINLAFISHFQNMAKAHFTIRQLERKYGEPMIRETYESLVLA